MDCLVQHEFFHRYTADEHTLRCIDMLDSLTDELDEQDPGRKLYRQLLHNVEDPIRALPGPHPPRYRTRRKRPRTHRRLHHLSRQSLPPSSDPQWSQDHVDVPSR